MQSSFSRFSLQMNETNKREKKKKWKEIKSNQIHSFNVLEVNVASERKLFAYAQNKRLLFLFKLLNFRQYFFLDPITDKTFTNSFHCCCYCLPFALVVGCWFFFINLAINIFVVFFSLLKLKLMNHTVNQNPVCHVMAANGFWPK